MIIDSHLHAGEYLLHYTEDFAAQMMDSIGAPNEAITTHIPTLLAEMDAAGIDKVFLLAFDAQRTLGVKVPNEYVAEICRTHSDRFIGFCSVDAGVPGAAEIVQYSARTLGLRGVKTAPAYIHLSPSDRCWYDTYEVAQSLNLPILVHTGFTPSKRAAARFFPPMLLSQAARDFPRLRFIMAHLGTPWISSSLDMLATLPNLYADLSIFGWYQPIEALVDALTSARKKGVLDRLLWGTDYPWGPLTPYLERMRRLTIETTLFSDGKVLTEQEWSGLMGENALCLV